jgi:7-carboxy-7-deazaguanine synthase
MSPKLKSSCVVESKHYSSHQEKRLKLDVISKFIKKHDYQLKFVVNEEEELTEIKNIIADLEQLGHKVDKSKVLLMPQAVTKEQLENRTLQLVEWAKQCGFRFCDRLHVRIWGDKRGV